MIKIENVSKAFDDIKAVDRVSVEINEKIVFGLLGTNGAGKSTLLRMAAGVLKPDSGTITVDDKKVYDNPAAKRNIYFVSDTPYFFPNATPEDMEKYLINQYPDFASLKFARYLKSFSFDGLDPVMRQGIKSIFAKEMDERGLTPVIASHNLRELEDICDHVGLLHRGGVLLSKDLDDLKLNIQRVQCVFASEEDEKKLEEKIDMVKEETSGSLRTYTIRGTREDTQKLFGEVNTIFYEILPLSLVEIFISETEVAGYDIKKLIMG